MRFLIFTILVLNSMFFFYSCSKQSTYIRYTDLHHVEITYLTLTESSKDSIQVLMFQHKNDTLQFVSISNNDSLLTFIEGKKVVKIDSSYFIRKDVKNDQIIGTYYNRDVKF